MKRFHVHLAVADLAASITFYQRLFGQAPAKQTADYAKWMLDDPRVNFALSARGHAPGLNHLGLQVDHAEELLALQQQVAAAGTVHEQGLTTCCYAVSDKHWLVDPQGVAWEHFYTMAEAHCFGADTATSTGACCVPAAPASAACHPSQADCCG